MSAEHDATGRAATPSFAEGDNTLNLWDISHAASGVTESRTGERKFRGEKVLTKEEAKRIDFPYPPEPDL